jgi:adenylate cyclase
VTDEEPADLVEDVGRALLGSHPTYTRSEVAEHAGIALEVAEELWQQLGFPHAAEDDVAFTDADLEALERTKELIALGILTPDSQAALVRTWGRSFARLAEWQVSLLAGRAIEGDDPEGRLAELMDVVLPNVEKLQAYIWRRHLASASNRLLVEASLAGVGATSRTAVAFVDIVGYTGQSKNLTDHELVDWIEYFEDEMTRTVVEHTGRVIKTIGDEILFVTDDPREAAEVALEVTERGADPDDRFPEVRAGIAYGDVVSRLGDVFGPTVNIASRLTSVARPGTVLVDRGLHEVLSGPIAEDSTATVELSELDPPPGIGRILDRAAEELAELSPYSEAGGYRFRRMPRRSVKGYSKLEPFVLRRAKGAIGPSD